MTSPEIVLATAPDKAGVVNPITRRWVLLTIFVFALNLFGLGRHGLFEPDEGRYANMALEFLEPENHWAEPSLSEVGHFDKPPLIYWVTGASIHLLGMNEFAARLPSFLGSLLGLGGVLLIALRQYGERAAWWSVLVCATSLQYWALAHLLSPDMLMCGFCTLGAGLVLWGGTTGARASILWALGALCWTLAWWTKATPALVPLGALTAALLLTGRRDLLANLRPIRLLAVILVFGSPWYIAMMLRHDELVDFFLNREVVGRIVGHEDGRTGFPGFHFAVAAGFWLPWWPVITYHARKEWRNWRIGSWRERLRSLPWEPVAALFVLVIFSFVSSKLVTYTITGIPFLALGVGRLLAPFPFSLKNRFAWVTVASSIGYCIVILVLPQIEFSLGRNSSTQRAVEALHESGAEIIIADRFLPGLEFYHGESVWYVNTKDLFQAENVQGQDTKAHFLGDAELADRIRETESNLWLLQTGNRVEKWELALIENRSEPEAPPIVVGEFRLWQIK